MKTLEEYISELRGIDLQRGPTYVTEFEAVLAEIAKLNSAETIGPLIVFLRDDAPYQELMFSIIHMIEVFDDSIYVQHLLKGTEGLLEQSPYWVTVLYMRILNADASRAELIRQVRISDLETKRAIVKVMECVRARSGKFEEKTGEVVLVALQGSS